VKSILKELIQLIVRTGGEKLMKLVHMVAFAAVIVGALNWGLIAFFNFNLVGTIFGAGTLLERAIYAVVGISAVILAATHWDDCSLCERMMKSSKR
jgi:uncharacterized protein